MKSKFLGITALALACGITFSGEVSAQTATSKKAAVAQQDTTSNSVTQWQQELLGQYANVNALTATNLRQAYITLLESARAKQNEWNDQEWKKVQAVMNKLDAKKNSLNKQLGADDKAKIKVLQGELRALEGKGDIED
ncbi:hypothetical protein [Pontibacter ruber]|nr:hypothetical protein [Pontibacter ruber]